MFVISVMAARRALIEAVSMDEAIGKGHAIVRKLRPPADGWGRYHVCASTMDPVSLENLASLRLEDC